MAVTERSDQNQPPWRAVDSDRQVHHDTDGKETEAAVKTGGDPRVRMPIRGKAVVKLDPGWPAQRGLGPESREPRYGLEPQSSPAAALRLLWRNIGNIPWHPVNPRVSGRSATLTNISRKRVEHEHD